ncbi:MULTISPECIES: DUF305 domain-containing protein [Rhizobium/Agrobacterium group]|uniref:DUF305 domain-containing protein n=3 Tax=Rhizobium/Agrobacterium group TaxID=227290 RepID=A0A504TRI2_9HYPH|nr:MULTISPECIES: DUF305 domain-containing protein [Rhizobium/Agrobacterium group]MQB23183.1 DUF305 domain-containing protein [Agrobacterium tumefaciens]MDQ0457521.1 uncharacterized protein (DUF305 family) [Rhizobium paknamense]MDX8317332.1 DUF305 domain-containing protein [Agrobacterium rosae]OLP57584.1 hypothetical protein BJF92_23390 [Xaviernesmea rhizosphaerae]TPP04974.1 DUF305 domain-containing protein [Rhizobium glycinendophyticum]
MRVYSFILVASFVFVGSASAEQSHDHHPAMSMEDSGTSTAFSKSMKVAMDKMHAGMMAVPETGNPDHDFLAQMIPHHQGAIDMAKAVLLTTKDPQIRNLAQSIITEQAYEIQLMNSMLTQQRGSVAANPETSK